MKATLWRWCTVVVFALLMIGCDGDGGDDDEHPNALTVANLQGTYDLHTDAMPGDLAGDDEFNVISGMLEIDANTLTFTLTFAGMGPFTLAGTTLTVTDGDGNTEDLHVTLSDTGNTLTIIPEDDETFVFTRRDGTGTSNEVTEANLQGTYDLDVTNTTDEDLVSGEVDVVGNIVSVSLTGSLTGSFTLVGNTITLTDTAGGTTVLRATLSHDGNTLTLVDEDSDTVVFARR